MTISEEFPPALNFSDAAARKVKELIDNQVAEIERLKALCITYIDDGWFGTSSYQAKIDEVNNERK
jgi:hypothetical protein